MNDELNPNERDAFEALPRERQAPRALEERVLGALRREGLVRAPRAARPAWWSWRLVPAMAAGLALFAGGVVVGVRLEPTVAPRSSLTAASVGAGGDRAARIERSGSRYLDELTALSRATDTTQSPERARGRLAAGRILRQAAQEVARMDPNDPLAERILGGGELVSAQLANNEPTHFVWY